MMNYELVDSLDKDIEKIAEYKRKNIFEFASNLSDDELDKINTYLLNRLPKEMDNCKSIIINGDTNGCVITERVIDGLLLDEIYIEEEYRNNGIGTDIINSIIKDNNKVYLWVYKLNTRAVSLYKRLGFDVIDETDTRYYMERINS